MRRGLAVKAVSSCAAAREGLGGEHEATQSVAGAQARVGCGGNRSRRSAAGPARDDVATDPKYEISRRAEARAGEAECRRKEGGVGAESAVVGGGNRVHI